MRTIHEVIEVHSPYLLAYRHIAEVDKIDQLSLLLSANQQFRVGKDKQRYNMPHHDKVAVVFARKDGIPQMEHEIVVYSRDQPLQHLSYMSANCDSIIYPILRISTWGSRLALWSHTCQ